MKNWNDHAHPNGSDLVVKADGSNVISILNSLGTKIGALFLHCFPHISTGSACKQLQQAPSVL